MSFTLIAPQGTATVTLTANQKIAVKTLGEAQVLQVLGFPNYPDAKDLIQTVSNTTWTSSAFASGATLVIQAGALPVLFAAGTDPVVSDSGIWQPQGAPGTLNASGTLTAALLLGGIVTTTATNNPTVATLVAGATLDDASAIAIGESFDWAVINTGANSFDVTSPGASHTVVPSPAPVAGGASASFRTRKTAADTFISYRIG